MTETHIGARSFAGEVEGETTESEGDGATRTCSECGGRLRLDEAHGETACVDCGLVVEADAIDHGPEWRAFDHEESRSRSRVGAPRTVLMHDNGLSSKIGWGNKDAAGNVLPARQRERMQRLRTWDERFRTRSSAERNLKQALGEIERMASALGIPETARETASVIYRRALEADLLPGRSIEGVATAALYAAARQAGVPRRADEVAAVSRVDALRFKRTYRYVIRELDLKVGPVDPERFVSRIAADLDVDEAAERRTYDLLQTAKERAIHSGKSPAGLAAAAIYAGDLLGEGDLTQAEVSDAAGVSEETIRNRYRELLEAAEEPDPA